MQLHHDLRRLHRGGQPLTGHHYACKRLGCSIHLWLYTENHWHLRATAGPFRPWPGPIVAFVPNPESLPVHIFLLSAQLQVKQLFWITNTWACRAAQKDQVHPIVDEPQEIITLLCEHDRHSGRPAGRQHPTDCPRVQHNNRGRDRYRLR